MSAWDKKSICRVPSLSRHSSCTSSPCVQSYCSDKRWRIWAISSSWYSRVISASTLPVCVLTFVEHHSLRWRILELPHTRLMYSNLCARRRNTSAAANPFMRHGRILQCVILGKCHRRRIAFLQATAAWSELPLTMS